MATYRQKLLDPRWQRLRLVILARDQWTCQICGNTTNTLHVHHVLYHEGSEPWEAPPFELVTLCATCHEAEHEELRFERQLLQQLLASAGIRTSKLLGEVTYLTMEAATHVGVAQALADAIVLVARRGQ